ncbi:MAG TPA: PmoA family protein [Tepidisphaeraceae bacterium]
MTLSIIILSLLTSLSLAADPAIQIVQGQDKLEITIDGKPFTTYHFVPTSDDPEWHRPYFFPVLSADGVELTADRDRETMGQEKREHPWHRSVWIGHGDINGIDHWTHPRSGKKLQRHVQFSRIDKDSFVEELAWEGTEPNKPVLTELRTVRFVAYDDGARGIDVTSQFTATSGDAVFKVKPLNVSGVEAGWLAARVSGQISASKESQITSSAGAAGEKEAREKPANWCDYSGPIGGKVYGVAEFDSPGNPGNPAPFHVREFGLLTQIGVHDWTLKSGESQSIRHMLLFHSGDAKSAKLDERFAEFAKAK